MLLFPATMTKRFRSEKDASKRHRPTPQELAAVSYPKLVEYHAVHRAMGIPALASSEFHSYLRWLKEAPTAFQLASEDLQHHVCEGTAQTLPREVIRLVLEFLVATLGSVLIPTRDPPPKVNFYLRATGPGRLITMHTTKIRCWAFLDLVWKFDWRLMLNQGNPKRPTLEVVKQSSGAIVFADWIVDFEMLDKDQVTLTFSESCVYVIGFLRAAANAGGRFIIRVYPRNVAALRPCEIRCYDVPRSHPHRNELWPWKVVWNKQILWFAFRASSQHDRMLFHVSAP